MTSVHSLRQRADRLWLFYILILTVFGLVVLTSASSPIGYERFHDTYFFIKRQVFLGLLPGLFLFLLFAKIDYRWWRKIGWLVYGLSLLLLALVFVPSLGVVVNGSHSWLKIVGSYTFQPAELAKLGIIIITASLLSEPARDLADWKNGLLPILAILAPALLLILAQPDLGTVSILVIIIFLMLYVGRLPKIYLFIFGLGAILAFAGLVWMAPYRVQRLTTFLHPELDPQGVGYHINQAFLAIGSGGFWGLGLGHSRQKFQYLPEVSADSIYAIMAEELGFLFAAGLVILILLIGWRGFKIAKAAPDEFGRLLVSGIIIWLVWQSFLNIGAMVGVLPLTGVPLPFISHGGSALMVMLAAVGIAANVSRQR